MTLMEILTMIVKGLPRIIEIITHYEELVTKGEVTEGDKEKAKAHLDSLKIKDWGEL